MKTQNIQKYFENIIADLAFFVKNNFYGKIKLKFRSLLGSKFYSIGLLSLNEIKMNKSFQFESELINLKNIDANILYTRKNIEGNSRE